MIQEQPTIPAEAFNCPAMEKPPGEGKRMSDFRKWLARFVGITWATCKDNSEGMGKIQ